MDWSSRGGLSGEEVMESQDYLSDLSFQYSFQLAIHSSSLNSSLELSFVRRFLISRIQAL